MVVSNSTPNLPSLSCSPHSRVCLQVSLDGSLVPLPPDQVQQLKARCGRGGLRVLALAYKDMLLQPSAAGDSSRRSSSSSGGGASDWQLLDGDDEQQDLVLIGLLALEDPGGVCWCGWREGGARECVA